MLARYFRRFITWDKTGHDCAVKKKTRSCCIFCVVTGPGLGSARSSAAAMLLGDYLAPIGPGHWLRLARAIGAVVNHRCYLSF
jgi:hypothetical protein